MQDFFIVYFLHASFPTANTLLTALKQPLDGSGEPISGNGPHSPYTGLLEDVLIQKEIHQLLLQPSELEVSWRLEHSLMDQRVLLVLDAVVEKLQYFLKTATKGTGALSQRKNHSSTGVAKTDCITGAGSPPFTPREKLFCIISPTWPSLHR